jgi:hypothetical protein
MICRPFSPKTMMTKLGAALAAPSFFGPGRRAKSRPAGRIPGEERRARTAKKTKMSVSLNPDSFAGLRPMLRTAPSGRGAGPDAGVYLGLDVRQAASGTGLDAEAAGTRLFAVA